MELETVSYFDFLNDFVKQFHQEFTSDNVVMLVRCLVKRVQNEMGKRLTAKKTKSGELRIKKCWNSLRFVVEHKSFIGQHYLVIEQEMKPMILYLTRPFDGFDEDVYLCINNLIRQSQQVSPLLQEVFPSFRDTFERNAYCFGILLSVLNSYIYYDQGFIANRRESLSVLIEIATLSLYQKEPPIILSNNAEGGLLMALIFQNLNSELVQQCIGEVLTNALSRLRLKPMSPCFQRVLLEIFLSAFILNADLTMQFMVQAQYVDEFFTQIL